MKDEGVRISLSAEPGAEQTQEGLSEGRPFRILLFGNFGLRGAAAGRDMAPVEVTSDNCEEILRRWTPGLELPGGVRWRAESIDDFHPDALAESLPEMPVGTSEQPAENAVAAPPDLEGGLSLLEQMLGGRLPEPGPAQEPPRRGVVAGIDEEIRKIAREHSIPGPGVEQAAQSIRRRQAKAECLRQVLEFAPFRLVEENWRSVYFLIERLEPGSEIQLFLADVALEEFVTDLVAGTDLRQTAFYRTVVRDATETFGAMPWAVVAGLFDLTPEPRTLMALSRAGRIAAAGGTCLVLGAGRQWLELSERAGGDRLGEAWRLLRASQEAARIGLAYPRFLLRPGYGPGALSADVFEDEQVLSPGLFGSPALACVTSLGLAFRDLGWEMHAGARLILSGLPVVTSQQPLERILTEGEAEAVLDQGIMPLVWWKGTDRIGLLRIQSIGEPPMELQGLWG